MYATAARAPLTHGRARIAARMLPEPMDDTFYPNHTDQLVSLADAPGVGGRSGRVLARVDDPSVIRALAGVADVRVVRGGIVAIQPETGADDLALARTLHGRADVQWAMPDLLVALDLRAEPQDPYVSAQWHLENTGQRGLVGSDINASLAWAFTGGAGQRIAIIDTGVQLDHPDLVVLAGSDFLDGDADPSPGPGYEAPHGTACAGVAAGRGGNGLGGAGVAWEADVYAQRLIGGYTPLEALITVFAEAVDAGATVLSNSWGFGTTCYDFPTYSPFLEMASIAENEGRGGLGAVVVFAAGNGACNVDGDGMLQVEDFLVVAAVESWDERAWYSNFGTAVDISAPTSLLTTDMIPGGYGSYGGDDAAVDSFGGTSAATPVVAGVAALMMAANPRITAEQVRGVMCDTATKVDPLDAAYDVDGHSIWYGCGRIDAGAAVAAVANSAPEAPVPILVSDPSYEGRLVMAWEPARDDDDDVIDYVVEWWTLHPEEPHVIETADTWIDIGDRKTVKPGDVVSWTVRARDPWGDGPASGVVVVGFEVAPEPPPTPPPPPTPAPEGCASAPGGGGAWLLGLALLRRRR